MFSETSDHLCEQHSLLFNWFIPGAKGPSREADRSSHPVPSLRMSGAKPLFTLYAFVAWTGSTVPSLCGKIVNFSSVHTVTVGFQMLRSQERNKICGQNLTSHRHTLTLQAHTKILLPGRRDDVT
jgi:hypothetical protein